MAHSREKKAWPSWRYGPGGARRIFNEGDVIPDGWEDHPDKVKEPEPKSARKSAVKSAQKSSAPPAGAEPEDAEYRAEAIEFLKAAGRDVSNITDETSIEEIEAMMNEVEKEGAK